MTTALNKSAKTDFKPTDPKAIMDAIAQEAEQIWGEDWFVQLVRRYCEIESEMTSEKPLARQRRSQIERAMKSGGTSTETMCWLAAAVNMEIQLVVHRIEVRRL